MKQKIFKEKYSLYEISYAKDEIRHNSVDEIIADLNR